MQTIGLAMLVKDESEVLPATLDRIRPVIDAWTVMDTGSTDDSREIAKETLSGLPGELVEQPFTGFGPARTMLLEAARGKADYTLMLDADHVLSVQGKRPELTADSYLLRVESGALSWRLPLLTRSDHPFTYRGAAHSYLFSPVPTRNANLDWLAINGGGGVTREKLQRDRILLEQAIADDPDDVRSVFYLAQTYRDLDMPERAVAMYLRRAEMGGWDEEVYYSRFQAGVLLSEHVSFAEGASELLEAWYRRPHRAEALRALANAANAVADKLDPPDDILFVTPTAYRKAA